MKKKKQSQRLRSGGVRRWHHERALYRVQHPLGRVAWSYLSNELTLILSAEIRMNTHASAFLHAHGLTSRTIAERSLPQDITPARLIEVLDALLTLVGAHG